MSLPRTRSLRDVILILLGATSMHLASIFLGIQEPTASITVNTQVSSHFLDSLNDSALVPFDSVPKPDAQQRAAQTLFDAAAVDLAHDLPETTIVSHAPGWTVFRNLYMSNGTLYIVSSQPASSFPAIQYITSTGLPAENTPENIAARLPTREQMDFLTPAQARGLWGGDSDPAKAERNRIWPVAGNTFLVNEPPQFLDHYYHFCAEYFFGAWAFWSGTFEAAVDPASAGTSSAPPVHRLIFTHADANGWRDRPGFNAYFLRAVLPSVTVEGQPDWEDRVHATSAGGAAARAWHFDTVLLSDRSAAFRGEVCGSRTQRIAAEALEYMQRVGTLPQLWWEPVRRAVLRFAGVSEQTMAIGLRADSVEPAMPQRVVVSYISRQGTRRHLIDEDHDALVAALTAMCMDHGWELNVVQAERLSKEEQLALAARTTIMIGVHGNGLTHLIMMPVTPVSTVIELFYPEGFAHDYEWTTHARGMRHFAVWNDTYKTYPEVLWPAYPEGFQGTQIPVYAPIVTQIVQDRVAGRLP